MSLFSESTLTFIIYGAIVWTALGVVILITLLIKDILKKQIW